MASVDFLSNSIDAPLGEAGNPTPKILVSCQVIEKYRPTGQPLPPAIQPHCSFRKRPARWYPYRLLHQNSLQVASPACSFQLDTLVENMGRINFGNYLLNNTKDSTKSVRLGGQEVKLAHVQLTLRQCPSRS